MTRLQTGYIPPDPRWPVPQSLLDNLAAARPCARDLPSSPWLEQDNAFVDSTNSLQSLKSA
ncbi:hypothetical protein CSC94_14280 [Zhengella mangrovi]|uniref:Uncharacterized protein n=1 Tax=Zhengella mangrovi TaxID=1982044 RepID=A0A2G1QMJ0_9HYPH|nr:hypothetical protein [Zhengella mangrovi]PHP66448.1 hypothetical protein CSC94_14280 [Zhengella mangrovi]